MNKLEILDKLDVIDALYPPQRIAASKERLQRMWDGKRPLDRYPYTHGNLMFSYYDDVDTSEQRLIKLLDEIIVRGKFSDDYIPSLFTGCKQSTIPTMFGAEEVIVGNDYTCKKIIHCYEDIDNLPEPSCGSETTAGSWLEMQQYMLDITDGRIPIHVTDMQGPMDVAGQVWGYDNMFICAMEKPEYYHRLMSKLTRAFIMFWKRQKELLGSLFVPTHLFGWSWVPEYMGASISCDSIVMVSPGFFDTFYAPYFEEISRELGNIALHSCGDFSAVFDNLVKVQGLKAINAGQMTVKELVAAGLNSDTAAIAVSDISHAADMFTLITEKRLRVDLSIIGMWPTVEYRKDVHRFASITELDEGSWDIMYRQDKELKALATCCADLYRQ